MHAIDHRGGPPSPGAGITRTRVGTISARLGLLALAAMAGACTRRAPPERIFLIVIDTLRRDQLSCYGGPTPTPNLDAIAARGQQFTNAFGSFHQTTMSMAALFTGRTPSLESGDSRAPLPWSGHTWCGLNRLQRPADVEAGRCIPADVPTLAARMHTAGFATLGVTSNKLLFRPGGYEQGFDTWIELGDPVSDHLPPKRFVAESLKAAVSRSAPRVVEAFLKALAGARRDRLFAYVHFMDVHDWYTPGSTVRTDSAYQNYRAAVAQVDAAVGTLMRALAADGWLERSAVVVVADHGEAQGEPHYLPGTPAHFGNPSFQPVLKIPLLVSVPTTEPSDAFLRTEDVFRLIARLAGLDADAASDLDRGELLLTEAQYQTYLSGRWKSMRERASARTVLFDLVADPGETQDVLAEHPDVAAAHASRVAALAERLASHGAAGGLSPEDEARLRTLGYVQE